MAGPFGVTQTFAYDAAGNRTRVEDSAGGVTTSAYDAENRLVAREVAGVGVTPGRVEWAYTARGQVGTLTRYADVNGPAVLVARTVTSYDDDGRVTGIVTRNGSGAVRSAITYTLDAAGNVTAKDDGAAVSYAYDAEHQLTADGAATFGYDATGNRTNTGYATGAGNRTSTDGTWTYTYDAFGAVTKRSQGATAETWEYGYDFAGRMVSAVKAATDGGAATARVTYVYDVFGNRVERDAWDGSTTTVERFVVDGWDTAKGGAVGSENFDAVLDLDGSNAVTVRRLFGAGFDEVVARQDAAGTVAWYVADTQGSVRQLLDNSGNVVGTLAYSAFGEETANSGAVDRYRYTGREWDDLLGLQYSRARVYDPASGMWLSADPMGFDAGDTNLYRYVGNRAATATDPSGKWVFVRDGDEGKLLDWLRQQGINARAPRNDSVTWTPIVGSRVRRVIIPDDMVAVRAWNATSDYARAVKFALLNHQQNPANPVGNIMYTDSDGSIDRWRVDAHDQSNAWREYILSVDRTKLSAKAKAELYPSQQARLFEHQLQANQFDAKSDEYYRFKRMSWKEAGRDAVIKQMLLKYGGAGKRLLEQAAANQVEFKSDGNGFFFTRATASGTDRTIRIAEKVGLPFLWLNSSMSVETAADYLYLSPANLWSQLLPN